MPRYRIVMKHAAVERFLSGDQTHLCLPAGMRLTKQAHGVDTIPGRITVGDLTTSDALWIAEAYCDHIGGRGHDPRVEIDFRADYGENSRPPYVPTAAWRTPAHNYQRRSRFTLDILDITAARLDEIDEKRSFHLGYSPTTGPLRSYPCARQFWDDWRKTYPRPFCQPATEVRLIQYAIQAY